MANEKKVTIKDIAERAGVHFNTVSGALRNARGYSAETCRRIQALAADMGYQSDPMLKALSRYRSRSRRDAKGTPLALVTAWPDNRRPYLDLNFGETFAGLSASARAAGFDLQEYSLTEPGMKPKRLFDILYTRGVHGLVLFPYTRREHASMDFDYDRFSLTTIGYALKSPLLHRAAHHPFSNMRVAFRNAWDCVWTRIGLALSKWQDVRVGGQWLSSYFGIREELNCPHLKPYVPDAELEPSKFRGWLKAERPEVLLCIDPASPMQLLEELGYRVPEDLQIVTLNHREHDPFYAGVAQQHQRIGHETISLLANLIYNNERGVPAIQKTMTIDGAWKPGRSLKERR